MPTTTGIMPAHRVFGLAANNQICHVLYLYISFSGICPVALSPFTKRVRLTIWSPTQGGVYLARFLKHITPTPWVISAVISLTISGRIVQNIFPGGLT